MVDEVEWVDTAQYGRLCGLKSDAVVFARAKSGGMWEPEVAVTFGRLIRPGSIAIDAGANIGLLSISMAVRSDAAQILAFEPHPEIFRCLKANAEGRPAIRPHNKAVGASASTMSMVKLNGDPNPAGAVLFDRAGDYPIDVIALDSLNLANVSLIKIDVEGHEQDVIAGAMGLIQRERPALIVEILPDDGARRTRLIEQVRAMGYAAEELNREDVLFTPV